MVMVTGKFDVRLRNSIPVSFEFWENKSFEMRFDVDGAKVMMAPLEFEPPFEVEGQYGGGPSLLTLRMWLAKEVRKLDGTPSQQKLPREERLEFESLINKATSRFITALKRRTNSWQLDHRLPVEGYSPEYFYQGESLGEEFPTRKGRFIVPEEVARGKFGWRIGDFIGEMTGETWEYVASEIQRPVHINHYDEAIFDAKMFRSNLSYDASLLYAAFASEAILRELVIRILRKSGKPKRRQVQNKLGDVGGKALVDKVKALDFHNLPNFGNQELGQLFTLRNSIAHRGNMGASANQANHAIGVAEQLKELLGQF